MAGGEAVLARDLAEIDTLFGRLVYLGSFRQPHIGLCAPFASAICDPRSKDSFERLLIRRSTISSVHEKIYSRWVKCPLHEKTVDINRYITGLNEIDKVELLDVWLRLTAYEDLIPDCIQGSERQQHLLNFQLLFEDMRERELRLVA
jgi:hypothetical protein